MLLLLDRTADLIKATYYNSTLMVAVEAEYDDVSLLLGSRRRCEYSQCLYGIDCSCGRRVEGHCAAVTESGRGSGCDHTTALTATICIADGVRSVKCWTDG